MGTAAESHVRVERLDQRGVVTLKLEGVLDETFDFTQLGLAPGLTVLLDLEKVDRITSFGVRQWMQGLKAAELNYVGYLNCRPTMVMQFNSIAGFNVGGELLSLYLPYLCPSCSKAFERPLDVWRKVKPGMPVEVPEASCPSCGTQAEFDDLPDFYFAYVNKAQPPTPPPIVRSVLEGDGTTAGVPFRVDKVVEGDLTALWITGHLDRTASFKRLVEGLEGDVLLIGSGLSKVTADGVAKLAPVLEYKGAQLWLARVPDTLLCLMAAQPWGNARLVSVLMGRACTKCGVVRAEEWRRERYAAFLSGVQSEERCPSCGETSPATVSDEVKRALTLQPLQRGPSNVVSYLTANLAPPAFGVDVKAPLSAASMSGNEGVFGRYQLRKLLGAGGMAQVYLASQMGVGGFEKKVVMKRILPGLCNERAFVEMFLQEARLSARIQHQNVVQIFDVGDVDGWYFIAMEYVKGWDLSLVLRVLARAGKSIPLKVACQMMVEVCKGLHAAHTCVDDAGQPSGVIHRDVSPHNILLSSEGQLKVTDFGIARAHDSVSNTPSATIKGKLSYLAPELLKSGAPSTDPRVDVFATGVVLFQCLTMSHPFRRDTEAATVSALLAEPITPPRALREGLPRELDQLVLRAMAREPEARFQTIQQLQRALEALLPKLPGGPDDELSKWVLGVAEDAKASGELPSTFTPSGADEGPTPKTRPHHEREGGFKG